jgi:hypothetical protein
MPPHLKLLKGWDNCRRGQSQPVPPPLPTRNAPDGIRLHNGTLHRPYSMAKRYREIINLMLRTVLSDRTALETERKE